jgi:hypothetical protein
MDSKVLPQDPRPAELEMRQSKQQRHLPLPVDDFVSRHDAFAGASASGTGA